MQSQNIFKESTGGCGGQDGCERRIKVFVKIQFFFFFFFFFFFWGGGGPVLGGHGRCEQSCEVFVKIKKKLCVCVGGGGRLGGSGLGGQGGCE